MLSAREIFLSLYGVWRLAHLDSGGLAFFNRTPSGALRSFVVAGFVAPVYALDVFVGFRTGQKVSVVPYALVELIAYVMAWVAYPVVLEALSDILRCRENFEEYLTAYNWSIALQNLIFVPLDLVVMLRLVGPDTGQALWLVAFLAMGGFLWFIARNALRVPPLTAAGLVLLDVLLSVLIDGIAARLY
ncbi:MAG: hypothetical protein IPK66_01455 [Rhodospirillales bacterium]|nr:hypothetical protein [Rhodospirillales bacterium]